MDIEIEVQKRRDLLIQQYKNSPKFLALINGFFDVLQTEFVNPLSTLSNYTNPDNAEGIWLDYLGLRLGLYRPTILDTSINYFGFDTNDSSDNNVGFDQGPFGTAIRELEIREPIGDEYYRSFLKARAMFLRSRATREDIENILDILFNGGGHISTENSFDITLTVDEDRLQYVNIVKDFDEKLIPRPVGVNLTITEA